MNVDDLTQVDRWTDVKALGRVTHTHSTWPYYFTFRTSGLCSTNLEAISVAESERFVWTFDLLARPEPVNLLPTPHSFPLRDAVAEAVFDAVGFAPGI